MTYTRRTRGKDVRISTDFVRVVYLPMFIYLEQRTVTLHEVKVYGS